MDVNKIHSLLKRINKIPNECRQFKVSSWDIQRRYGINSAIQQELRKSGLPYIADGKDFFYDGYDLDNFNLYLKLPSLQRMAMRSWSSTLRRLETEPEEISVQISFVPDSPTGNQKEENKFKLLIPNEGRIWISGFPGTELIIIHKTLRTTWPEFSVEMKNILKEVMEFDFFMLPENIRWDLDFIKRTKMCECGGASKFIFLEARNKGLEVRHQFGLLVAKPFSTAHFWVEFLVDDTWVPADPLLLKVLSMSTGLNTLLWTFSRSPGGAFIPLTTVIGYRKSFGRPILKFLEEKTNLINPAATQNGLEVPISFPTNFV